MKPMPRHVLVLDGPDASAFLSRQRLIPAHGGSDALPNPDADSREPRIRPRSLRDMHRDETDPDRWDAVDGPHWSHEQRLSPEELAQNAIIRHPALQSADGIQFYCFRGKWPYGPDEQQRDPDALDPNHLEYWVRRLDESLPYGQKLDAVVIPSPLYPAQGYPRLAPWIAKVKEQWPEVKVMVWNPPMIHPHKAGPDGREAHYLMGVEEPKPTYGTRPTLSVTPHSPEHALGHGVDLAVKYPAHALDMANQLRDLLGEVPLQPENTGAQEVANKENFHALKALERTQRIRARDRKAERGGDDSGRGGRG